MPYISEILDIEIGNVKTIGVPVDRHTLEKRRWRVVAADGTDLAVDLASPCRDKDVLLVQDDRIYTVEQIPEKVIRISLPSDVEAAAGMGWFFGNQHLQIEIKDGCIHLAHDEQLLMKLQRAGIDSTEADVVFNPDPHSKSHHHH